MPSHQVLQILSNPEGLGASGGPYLLPELGPSVDSTMQMVWISWLPIPLQTRALNLRPNSSLVLAIGSEAFIRLSATSVTSRKAYTIQTRL